MGKIRVMHLIHRLSIGGAENGIVNIVNHINQSLFDTSICDFDGTGNYYGCIDRNYTTLFKLESRWAPLFFIGLIGIFYPNEIHNEPVGFAFSGRMCLPAARQWSAPKLS